MTIHGCDVSSWQPNWTVPKGDDFAIFKATEGRTVVDKTCVEKTHEAEQAGLVLGYYHFLWPDNIDAQADYFLDHIPVDYPVMLACDWETTGDDTEAPYHQKTQWLKRVKDKRPDCKVGLYVNKSMWDASDKFAQDFLWIAWLSSNEPPVPWTIWQYTWEPYDKNRATFDSRADMQAWVDGDSGGGGGGAGLFGMTKSVYQRRSDEQ